MNYKNIMTILRFVFAFLFLILAILNFISGNQIGMWGCLILANLYYLTTDQIK